ncbi:MAG: hypothetical protein M3331_07390 [Actinomycetota bacterium]|nr:hypothetical protein [Actinomycetota bacterium]
MPAKKAPALRLGRTLRGGIAPSIFGLVERGVLMRPEHAATVHGRVQLRFRDGYPPVSMIFGGDRIEVEDGEVECPNLTVKAGLADVVLLTTAPLRLGMPSPANARGRAVLQKMARGEIRLKGDLGLARAMLELMRIDVPEARFAKPSEAEPGREPTAWIDVLT